VTGRRELTDIIGERAADRFCEWLGLIGRDFVPQPVGSGGLPRSFGGPVPQSDVANAERFSARHSDTAAYCPSLKRWLVWNGCRWLPDDGGHVMRLAILTGREIAIEA